MDKVQIIGHLGQDPEMHYTPAGDAVTTFSVASNRHWNDKEGNKHEQKLWVRCSAWGKQAEICNQYLKKGSRVFVEGRLSPDKTSGSPRIWQKQDGTAAASYEIMVREIEFLSPKSQDQDSGQETQTSKAQLHEAAAAEAAENVPPAPPEQDEIPF